MIVEVTFYTGVVIIGLLCLVKYLGRFIGCKKRIR